MEITYFKVYQKIKGLLSYLYNPKFFHILPNIIKF